jgi:ATP-dependent Clp protease ATP-binding subunit ClpA
VADPGEGPAFERLTEPARAALSYAQAEAIDGGADHIEDEHLLIGLLRARKGIASKALRMLDVRLPKLRKMVTGSAKELSADQPGKAAPSAGVKRVIERAFALADAIDQDNVWTVQLLGAIISDAESAGARLLATTNVSAEQITAEMNRLCSTDGPEPPGRSIEGTETKSPEIGMTGGLRATLRAARMLAEAEGAPLLRSDHLLAAMVSSRSAVPALVELLKSAGADIPSLRKKVKPERSFTRLERELLEVARRRTDAMARHQWETAAKLRSEELELRRRLGEALDAWQTAWASNGARPYDKGLRRSRDWIR